MRPVNLLPQRHRPVQASGRLAGSSYVLLGALGVLLLALLLYVMTLNGVNDRKGRLAAIESETAAAQAQLSSLGEFASFLSIKQTRVAAVTALASQRFDFERLVREIARVVPENVVLTQMEVSTTGVGSAAGTSSGTPGMTLTACAPSQAAVATSMVRLRRLYRSEDVVLVDSTRDQERAAAVGDGGCAGYVFNVRVQFAAGDAPGLKPRRVPGTLGGGA